MATLTYDYIYVNLPNKKICTNSARSSSQTLHEDQTDSLSKYPSYIYQFVKTILANA